MHSVPLRIQTNPSLHTKPEYGFWEGGLFHINEPNESQEKRDSAGLSSSGKGQQLSLNSGKNTICIISGPKHLFTRAFRENKLLLISCSIAIADSAGVGAMLMKI